MLFEMFLNKIFKQLKNLKFYWQPLNHIRACIICLCFQQKVFGQSAQDTFGQMFLKKGSQKLNK